MGALIGVDIGQTHDPTAICVAEDQARNECNRTETHYLVRLLERLPLGTPYPQVVRRLRQIIDAVRQRAARPAAVYIDATGVGKPVVDMLREGAIGSCDLHAVYFTHGKTEPVTTDRNGRFSVAIMRAPSASSPDSTTSIGSERHAG